MREDGADARALIRSLLLLPRMQQLWDVGDRGVAVFVHSVDVAALALERAGRLDRLVVTIGALIHDASKAPLALPDGISHSYAMRVSPELAARAPMELVEEAEAQAGARLSDERRAHVRHIVLSHHGAHGKLAPETPEARLVAAADQLSGTEHRLAPVDANDILPLLSEGYRWRQAAVLLGVTREVIKTRLREACDAAGKTEWVDLLPIWRRDGRVSVGDARMERRLARARDAHRLARSVPGSIIERMEDGEQARVAGRPALPHASVV